MCAIKYNCAPNAKGKGRGRKFTEAVRCKLWSNLRRDLQLSVLLDERRLSQMLNKPTIDGINIE